MSKGNTHELLNNVYHGVVQVCLHICAVHTPYTHLFRAKYIYSHTLHTYAAPRYTPLEMTCIFSYPTHTSLGLYTYILTPLHTCVAPQYTSSGTSWVWVCLNTPVRFVVVGVSTTLGQMLHLQHRGCGCVYNICADVASTTCVSTTSAQMLTAEALERHQAAESVGCEKFTRDTIRYNTHDFRTPYTVLGVRHARIRLPSHLYDIPSSHTYQIISWYPEIRHT